MKAISRRKFLHIFSWLSFAWPLSVVAASSSENKLEKNISLPTTVAVLRAAFEAEMLASENYVAYCRKAGEEKYLNIAYLFKAFSVSEKIHAENYKRILAALSVAPEAPEFKISVLDTKTNLINAAEGELKKIQKTYPDFLAKLKNESYAQAVISCMYSWKSHQQHEQKINEIRRYSDMFFGSVAQKIEGAKFDFYVCEICGSTIDEAPETPCHICNYPILHYHKIIRPV
jgi:rubrerythrin